MQRVWSCFCRSVLQRNDFRTSISTSLSNVGADPPKLSMTRHPNQALGRGNFHQLRESKRSTRPPHDNRGDIIRSQLRASSYVIPSYPLHIGYSLPRPSDEVFAAERISDLTIMSRRSRTSDWSSRTGRNSRTNYATQRTNPGGYFSRLAFPTPIQIVRLCPPPPCQPEGHGRGSACPRPSSHDPTTYTVS